MAAKSSGSLRAYLLTRIVLIVPMVLILLTIVFILMRVAPGDPVQAALGGRLPQAVLDAKRHDLGLDKPLYIQYFGYLGSVLTGDFGQVISQNRSVVDVITHEGAATLELTFSALVVALAVGLSVGLVIGRVRDSWVDVIGRVFGILTYAAPVFFVGILAILLFSVKLGWLPASGQADPLTNVLLVSESHTNIFVIDAIINGDGAALKDVLLHLVLPAVTLGLLVSGTFIRLVRVNLIQTLKNDYVEAARARGIGEGRVVLRHAFRNALVPVITVIGLQAALLLSGAVLTEVTFNWPGIGQALINYLNNRDYAAVQGIVTVFALVVVVVSLLIDVVNALIDPRVRY